MPRLNADHSSPTKKAKRSYGGRRKEYIHLTLSLDAELYRALDDYCRQSYTSKVEVVERLIAAKLRPRSQEKAKGAREPSST